MTNVIKNTKDYFARLFEQPNVNSRFVFFLHAVITSICTIVITIAFILAKDKNYYTDFLIVLMSGGVVGGGLARYMSKRSSGETVEQEITTTTKKGGVAVETNKTVIKPPANKFTK